MHNTDYIFDAIVIGSGPSGTICAENLVKKKMKVCLFASWTILWKTSKKLKSSKLINFCLNIVFDVKSGSEVA